MSVIAYNHYWRFEDDPSINDIVRAIEGYSNAKAYTYVICGRPGPTGKTGLCTYLTVHGFNAVEISEGLYSLVDYIHLDKNHVRVDHIGKCVLIVLNRIKEK